MKVDCEIYCKFKMSSFELILQKYSLFIIIFCLLLCIASSCIIFSVIRVVIPHESYVVRDTNPAEMKRDDIDETLANSMLAHQLSNSERLSRAHDIINNSEDGTDLVSQVATLHDSYILQASNR